MCYFTSVKFYLFSCSKEILYMTVCASTGSSWFPRNHVWTGFREPRVTDSTLISVSIHTKKACQGAPGWRSRLSVRLQPGHDLAVREFEPRVERQTLRAWSLFPVLCLPLSPPLPPFMLCLSLSQK